MTAGYKMSDTEVRAAALDAATRAALAGRTGAHYSEPTATLNWIRQTAREFEEYIETGEFR